jgi:hypothetical protein
VLFAVACATPTPAQAAFAPELSVGVTPATPAAAPAITATVSQPAGATPVQRFTLSLPAGFTTLGAPAAGVCPLRSLLALHCPAASRIGTLDAVIGGSVAFSGAIHKAGPTRFGVVAGGLGGAVKQAIGGAVRGRADGSLDLTLDQLPALAFTRLTVQLDGGGRSLFGTPARCGAYPLDGKFTSRRGEMALARTIVRVLGCPGTPVVAVSDVRLSRVRLRPGFGTVLRWTASQAADHTLVRVERRAKGRWRAAGGLVAEARAGENVLRWDGAVDGRRLEPAGYALRVQPAESAPSARIPFRVVGPGGAAKRLSIDAARGRP